MLPIKYKGVTFIAKVIGNNDEVANREEIRYFFKDWVHRVYGESHAGKSGSQRTEHRDETDDYR